MYVWLPMLFFLIFVTKPQFYTKNYKFKHIVCKDISVGVRAERSKTRARPMSIDWMPTGLKGTILSLQGICD